MASSQQKASSEQKNPRQVPKSIIKRSQLAEAAANVGTKPPNPTQTPIDPE